MDVASYFDSRHVLESERLLMRVIVKEDADDFYRYAKEDALCRYLIWNPHTSRQYTVRYIERVLCAYRDGRFFEFALVEKATRRMIGTCGITRVDAENRCAEIGYVIATDCQGKGYATEAVRTMLAFLFNTFGFHRVEARFMKGNAASLRVMEKNGMHFEGYLADALFCKGEYRTVGVAAILKDEYRKNSPDAVSPCRTARREDYPDGEKRRFRSFFHFFV